MRISDERGSVTIKKVLLKGGRVLDPESGLDKVTDIVIADGKIQSIGKYGKETFNGMTIDCKKKVIIPGLIDMHVHLREPGREDAETIESGCRSASSGGFTAVCCMPNTNPVVDTRGLVEFIKERSKSFLVDVYPIAAVSKGQAGEELTEMGDMLEAGAVGFSDDGFPVKTASLLRKALEYAGMFGYPIIDHCEDLSLSQEGVMHEGIISTILGLQSIPAISEDVNVARDLLVAEYTGGKLHIAHVSSAGSVELIRTAKARGVRVTAETCPHYLVMTHEAVRTYDTNAKMKPPLRADVDRDALIQGLADGTIDVIATDHAPHTIDDKEIEFDAASFGIVGLETAVGLILTHMVGKGYLTLEDVIYKMSINPRKIINRPVIHIKKGDEANFTIIDQGRKWKVDKTKFQSKSNNTPFHGWQLQGRCVAVINHGQLFVCAPEDIKIEEK